MKIMLLRKAVIVVFILTSFSVFLLTSGCFQYEMGSGSPIRVENTNKLVKGQSTKADVIELFGMPQATLGFDMQNVDATNIPRGVLISGDDKIYIYNQKTFTTKVHLYGLYGGPMEQGESCEQLAIVLDKNDVVRTFSYHKDDPVTEENISKLEKGKSTKYDVIELFGAPTSLNISGSDEIYVFRKCMTITSLKGLAGSKSTQKCKQLTIMLGDKGVVKTYSYQPYP